MDKKSHRITMVTKDGRKIVWFKASTVKMDYRDYLAPMFPDVIEVRILRAGNTKEDVATYSEAQL